MRSNVLSRRQTNNSLSFDWPCFLLLVKMSFAAPLLADGSREEKQSQLDAACEAAREKKLAPLRNKFVDECVRNKEQDSRAACQSYYADYGAQTGNRAPLFYDLPQCVDAFEYQQSQRQN
jgi:hypothetical protein